MSPGFNHRGRGRGGREGRGGRGGNRSWRGNRGNKRSHQDFGNSEWAAQVKDNLGAADLEFADYDGEKKHELPAEFVKLLNEDKTKAEDKRFIAEAAIGITEYMRKDTPGFSAILKHRFYDFIVHEIDQNGEVVRLTDLEVPNQTSRNAPTEYPTYTQLSEVDKSLFSQLSWTRLVQLGKRYGGESDPNKPAENDDVRIDVTTKTKDERKTYHGNIKALFPHLDTKTESEGEKKFVVVYYTQGKKANEWPRDRPKHLNFHLFKEGFDSSAAFGILARDLNIHNSKFKVAGNKDKRALTTQRVSVSWVTPLQLKRCVQRIRGRLFVGNFSFQKESLELGDLKGNHFTIVLRYVQESRDVVDKALANLRDNGFINYFGQQRFGVESTIKTSDIGLALIKSQWQEAIELIMKPRGNETPQMTRMRAHWWMYRKAGDAVVLLGGRMSQSKSLEANLLQGLAEKHENDYVGAIGSLQKNTKLLYVHAYQALVWNKAVSARIEKYGHQVLVGDFVLTDKIQVELDDEENATKRELKESKLIVVTEENKGDYSLTDIVMPIPGYKVSYPKNEALKQVYIDLLNADGLTKGFESLNHAVDMYALPGDYRIIYNKVTNVSWRSIKYDEPDEELTVSDIDIIRGRAPKADQESGNYEAVILDFSLPSSTYATMALREAMKVDMGKGFQTNLTVEYRALHNKNHAKEEEPVVGDTLDGQPTDKKQKSENDDGDATEEILADCQ